MVISKNFSPFLIKNIYKKSQTKNSFCGIAGATSMWADFETSRPSRLGTPDDAHKLGTAKSPPTRRQYRAPLKKKFKFFDLMVIWVF